MNTPTDLITAGEARRLLGISPLKLAELLKSGALRHYPNPLDRREKLVSKADVLNLKPKRAAA